jgi:hypothetical protein
MATNIRAAEPKDESRWRTLWSEYTDFYGVTVDPKTTDSVWSRVFSDSSTLFCRVAEVDGKVEGFALCLIHESQSAIWKISSSMRPAAARALAKH